MDLYYQIFSYAVLIVEIINPALVLFLLEEPLIAKRPGVREHWLWFWLRCVVGIGIAVLLAEAGKDHVVWPNHPTFPSGHTTFATAASAALVTRRGPRWLWLGIPLSLLMAFSLVHIGWHTVPDVIGGLALGPLVIWIVFRIGVPKPKSALPEEPRS